MRPGERRPSQAQPHNWLIFRIVEPIVGDALRRHARGRVADVGCGAKPWLPLLPDAVERCVGIEHSAARGRETSADLFASAYAVPADDESFDSVLCTYVLEHLEEPGDALREAFRILRPGGVAIYTVPLHWHLHEEPRDFYRFTRHGLRHLLEKHGFEVLEIRALTGFVATWGQALAYYLHERRRRTRVPPLRWLLAGLIQLVQGLALLLHRYDRSDRFTAEYLAVARKPDSTANDEEVP